MLREIRSKCSGVVCTVWTWCYCSSRLNMNMYLLISPAQKRVYLQVWQPHSVTELTPVNFQDSQPHSRNTRAVWMEQDWTTSCLSRHTARERDDLLDKRASTVCYEFSCVVSPTYSDGEMICHLKVLDPVSFPPEPLPSVLCSACDLNTPLSTQI